MARGGPAEQSSGSGGGAGGGKGRAPARATGKALAKFLSDIAGGGVAFALREAGLQDLAGKSASDISDALLDALAGPASTLDQHAAREALNDVIEEFLAGADTYEDVEKALAHTVDGTELFLILVRFFGAYLYRRFCQGFYETWVAKKGAKQAARSLQAVKDCIESAVKARLTGRNLKGIEWGQAEGTRMSEQILRDVLDIFGVTA
jgi:hypothetical protein